MVKPPLKTSADREALWAAVLDGTVDTIESDHAPHTREEKESADPPFGLPGLETTVPLMATAMRERGLSQERLIELLATNAQRIFGLVPPPQTYTLVDADASYVIADRGPALQPWLVTLCGHARVGSRDGGADRRTRRLRWRGRAGPAG